MDTNNPFANEPQAQALIPIPPSASESLTNCSSVSSATLSSASLDDSDIEEILKEGKEGLGNEHIEGNDVAPSEHTSSSMSKSLANLSKSLKRKRDAASLDVLGAGNATKKKARLEKFAPSALLTTATPTAKTTPSKANSSHQIIISHTQINSDHQVEVVEDTVTLDPASVPRLTKTQLAEETPLVDQDKTTHRNGSKLASVVSVGECKCIINTRKIIRKARSVTLSVQKGLRWVAFLKPQETITVEISPDHIREHLKGVILGLKPVVIVLEFDELPQLKRLLEKLPPKVKDSHRLFIRLPADQKPEDAIPWVSIFKTILHGPTHDDSAESKHTRMVTFKCVHNRDVIALALGNANSWKNVKHHQNLQLPLEKRAAFEIDKLIVTVGDIDRLQPERFLNDNLVDYYLKEIQQSLSEDMLERCYFFNSQFYPMVSLFTERAANRVPSKEVELFEKDFLFVPVCSNLHWTLCIVCFPRNVGVKGKGEESAHIEYCDSLGGISSEALSTVRKYLRFRWKIERPTETLKTFSPTSLPENRAILPRQNNNSDCGVFMLHYIEKFLEQTPELPLREADWFTVSDIARKRREIRNKARKRHERFQREENETSQLFL
uniref:Ubiquitin-like protease family profile domain-containing protein n=1 Tax=Percolomonas cosmopolitus TaxID=63605 RepID=A0A7S1PGF1_9EUKA|mmetsp:Transcript_5808/g.22035  ORF Transcript_5808/g.22035 Transcript_5808/m.22035 type:complete len:609 (+) Transcript_5808:1184-3010(+)